MNTAKTQCVDITASSPDLATPGNAETLYRSLGEHVAVQQVQDAAGNPIIIMHVTDSGGAPFLSLTYFPSLTDCQYVVTGGQ